MSFFRHYIHINLKKKNFLMWELGMNKKIKKPIKPRKSEKKNNRKNQLEKLKNNLVRFGFDFKRLKPNKPI